jgi:orotate phosphoribosyltransferase
MLQKEIAEFIIEHCMTAVEPGSDRMLGLLPGDRYTSIFQLGPLLMDYNMMGKIGPELNTMIEIVTGNEEIQLAGHEPHALAIITAINAARKEPYHAFWIRRERKNYGPHNVFEGRPDPNKKVVLLYDMGNSTNTFFVGEKVCTNNGLEVLPYNFAIFNKNNKEDMNPFKDKFSKRDLFTLINFKDIKDARDRLESSDTG